MQGYTNAPMRYLFRLLSSDAILWTEMEKVKDLLPATQQALNKRFGNNNNNDKLILQLGDNNPQTMQVLSSLDSPILCKNWQKHDTRETEDVWL